MDTELHRDVQRLIDRQRIVDLVSAYCDRFDRADADGVAELFTPDAVIDYNPATPDLTGDGLAAALRAGFTTLFAATSHHVTNVAVTFEDDDRARSTSTLYAWHRYRDGAPDGELWGRYLHRFHRTSDGWRIAGLVLQGAGSVDFHRAQLHGIGRLDPATGDLGER